MYIKQVNFFEYYLGFRNFLYFDNRLLKNTNIGYLSEFLFSDFGCIGRNLEPNIQHYFIEGKGVGLPTTHVSIDKKNNMTYIGITPDPCDEDDEGYIPMIPGKSVLEHFQEGILGSVHLSTENFFYILRTWDKYLDEKPPFLLLYQDENDWFDIMPFNSKEAMEFFVQEHTKI